MTIKTYIEFLSEMTMREFNGRYKKAIFGFLWVLLNPLLEMLIIGTIFSIFINVPNYYLFLFSGLLPWQFFSLSINKATPSFDHQRYLLKKASFPKEFIPLSIILANFINLLASLSLLICYLLITRQGSINIMHLISGLLWLLILSIGITLITSTINTRYRDVNFFTQTMLVLVFYATPVLYASNQLPIHLQNLLTLNPVTGPIEMIRSGLLGGEINNKLITSNMLITVIILCFGIYTYRKLHRLMVDWL